MKFSASNKKMIFALKPVVEVATKGTNKEAKNAMRVTVKADKDRLDLIAFGERMAIISRPVQPMINEVDYSFVQDGEITVNGYDLMNVLTSFPKEEKLDFTHDETANSLVVTMVSDSEQLQSMPLYSDAVEPPRIAAKFQKSSQVKRILLVEGLGKMIFATTYRKGDMYTKYMYVRTRCENNVVTFTSGDGGRFANFEVAQMAGATGAVGANVKDRYDYFFHKDIVPSLCSILKTPPSEDVACNEVVIQQAEKDGSTTPDEVVITCGYVTLVLVNLEVDIEPEWNKLDKLFKLDNPVIITTKVKDWELPVKGIRATWNEEYQMNHTIHNARIQMIFGDKIIRLEVEGPMKSKRKVPIFSVAKNADATFACACNTLYLKEMWENCISGADLVFEASYAPSGKAPLLVAKDATQSDAPNNVNRTFTALFSSSLKS